MENFRVAFIGSGNIASSMIGGLIANGMEPRQLVAADPDSTQQQLIAKKYGIRVFDANHDAAKDADVIVFAVKPQQMQKVVQEISENINIKNKLILSVVAGIKLQSIESWLGQPSSVIRVMPNMPALIQAGSSALYANTHVQEKQKNTAETIMRSVGTAIWLNSEDQLDTVTALSGSGPAYFFYFMELIESRAIEMGLDKEDAHLLTIETALGAARLALESNEGPGELREQVTSPRGTTEAAIAMLDSENASKIFEQAVSAAGDRSRELATLLDED